MVITIKVDGKVVYEGPSGDVDVAGSRANGNGSNNFGNITGNNNSYVSVQGSSGSRVVIGGQVMGDSRGGNGSMGNIHVTIEGDVTGNVRCDGSLQCKDIGGMVSTGGSAHCGNVKGSVNAGGSIRCENVGGSAHAGGSLNANSIGTLNM